MADWTTISALATAGGTLVLAAATFSSVKSANRAARVAERSLMAGLRPLLVPSRFDDPVQKVGFADEKWLRVPGGMAETDVTSDAIYLAMSLRNVATGIAVLHGWTFFPGRNFSDEHLAPEEFTRLSRDLYVPAGDIGFWQGVFRDPAASGYAEAAATITQRQPFTIDILYGDHEGGQRVITRFGLLPRAESGWIPAAGRHWNVDRADPR